MPLDCWQRTLDYCGSNPDIDGIVIFTLAKYRGKNVSRAEGWRDWFRADPDSCQPLNPPECGTTDVSCRPDRSAAPAAASHHQTDTAQGQPPRTPGSGTTATRYPRILAKFERGGMHVDISPPVQQCLDIGVADKEVVVDATIDGRAIERQRVTQCDQQRSRFTNEFGASEGVGPCKCNMVMGPVKSPA